MISVDEHLKTSNPQSTWSPYVPAGEKMSFPSTSPGAAPLGYLGTKVAHPVAVVSPRPNRDPLPSDVQYDIGTIWINPSLNRSFMLTSKQNGLAFWLPLAASTATIFQLTPDVGGAIPSVAGNIDLLGGSGLQTVGAGNTITITAPTLPQAILTTKFIANGTWTKNTATRYVNIYMWGGGAGGGGGRQSIAGTAASGGGSGAGGKFIALFNLPTADFPASSAIVVGAGGAGGAGGVAGNGTAGTVGGFSQVQATTGNITSSNSTAGLGGTTTLAGGGVGSAGIFGSTTASSIPTGASGQSAIGGSTAPTIVIPGNCSGGGGGGGVNAAGTLFAGGAGGLISFNGSPVLAGGIGGIVPGGNGAVGNSPTTQPFNFGGTGGGGGAGSNIGNGGNGGNGGSPGGGGGGGGGTQGAFIGGTGGTGARGEVWIIEYF